MPVSIQKLALSVFCSDSEREVEEEENSLVSNTLTGISPNL